MSTGDLDIVVNNLREKSMGLGQEPLIFPLPERQAKKADQP